MRPLDDVFVLRTTSVAIVFAACILGLAVWWLLHPVCVSLTAAEVTSASESLPLPQRTDRQLHGPIFQQRDAQWYQCKSWVSRQFFF